MHKFAWCPGKDLGHMEGLRQEALDLARAGNDLLVLIRELIHTQNGDNIAQLFVALQSLLDGTSNLIVLVANHLRVKLTTGRVEWVNRRINTQGSNITRQYNCRVQVQEGCSRRWVSQVISRYIHRLNRGNRPGSGRGNTLLELTHLFG